MGSGLELVEYKLRIYLIHQNRCCALLTIILGINKIERKNIGKNPKPHVQLHLIARKSAKFQESLRVLDLVTIILNLLKITSFLKRKKDV